MRISLSLLIAEVGTKGSVFRTEPVSLAPGGSWTLLPSCLAEAAGSSWRFVLLEPGWTWARRRCVHRWVWSANAA